jgi:2-methylcitrate dehydratase PrpD
MKNGSTLIVQATARLAEFVVDTQYHDFPEEVIKRAKLITADTIGVAIGGSLEPDMQQLYKRLPEGRGASLLKAGFSAADPSTTAFANATAICFLELDEGNRPTGHPALHVLPSVLALSEAMNKTGKEFLTAFILGYEVQCRIQHAARLRKIVHPHGNFGHVGAIAAIGKLLSWNAEQIRQGINAAAALAMATSWQPCFEGATVRNSYAGLTAQTAFTVKLMIESGFTGYDGALAETFGEILGEEFKESMLVDRLGSSYSILNNYFKFHAACALTIPALDALADALKATFHHGSFPPLKAEQRPNPDQIKQILVRVAQNAVKLNRLARPNQLSAKFSIPYALAAFVVQGSSDLDNFRGDYLIDQRINNLANRVVIQEDPELTARYPEEAPAEVMIELVDGSRYFGYCSNPFGSSPNPPTSDDLLTKFQSLTSGILNDFSKERLWNDLMNLEHQINMADLLNEQNS